MTEFSLKAWIISQIRQESILLLLEFKLTKIYVYGKSSFSFYCLYCRLPQRIVLLTVVIIRFREVSAADVRNHFVGFCRDSAQLKQAWLCARCSRISSAPIGRTFRYVCWWILYGFILDAPRRVSTGFTVICWWGFEKRFFDNGIFCC